MLLMRFCKVREERRGLWSREMRTSKSMVVITLELGKCHFSLLKSCVS